MHCLLFLILNIIFVTSKASEKELGCRDETGKLVDWFYLYKLPSSAMFNDVKSLNHPDNGLNYLYITSDSETAEWTLSESLINSTASIPGHTLSQSVFGDNEDNLIVMYNDQPPEGPGISSRGHSKGLVVTDGSKAFWMIHSVPHFPLSFENGAEYNYPNTGRMYGQSFLCISLNEDQMEKVGQQLIFNEVEVYASQVPEGLKYDLYLVFHIF